MKQNILRWRFSYYHHSIGLKSLAFVQILIYALSFSGLNLFSSFLFVLSGPCIDTISRANRIGLKISPLWIRKGFFRASRSRYVTRNQRGPAIFYFLRVGPRLGWPRDSPSASPRQNTSEKKRKKTQSEVQWA